MDKNAYKTYETLIDKFNCPIVGIDWVEDCILQKKFFWPYNQLINKEYATKSENTRLALTAADVDRMYSTIECADKQFKFLRNCVVYFPGNMIAGTENMYKKIVVVGGGIYFDQMMPNVTHVVTPSCNP